MPSIAIIGTGLIGGSLGLALKKANTKAEIVGCSRDYRNAQQARKLGAIDRAVRNPVDAVQDADLVVVATPPLTVKDIFQEIAPHLKEDCVVTDVTSTKTQVMAWAEEILPATAHFVGGHPMAGREKSSIDAAEAGLFQGCIYCVTPATSAHGQAVRTVVDVAVAVGGRPRFLDPAEHDAFVAGISHLPFMLSAALVGTTTGSPSWREMSPLAASGYRDTTRLASGDPTMHRDICVTNSHNIVRWIDECIEELRRWRQVVDEADADQLLDAFTRIKEARDRWTVRPDLEEEAPPAEIESSSESMSAMLFGHFKLPDFSKRPAEEDKGKSPPRR